MEENYSERNEIEQKSDPIKSLNTAENQEEIKNRLSVLFERLLNLESNHPNFLRNCENIRQDHFSVFEEYTKLKSEFLLLNPPKTTGIPTNDKNVRNDRNLNKLHSAVKKKEINIDNLNKLESLSVSSAKNNKPLKSDITPFNKKARPDSHSVKASDTGSRFNKKEPIEKDSYLQTDTDAQVKKKTNNFSPSKSINKSPLPKTENDKHKKTGSEFKKNSTSKDLSSKKIQIEKMFEKESKKTKDHIDNKSTKEKFYDKSASRNEKKNEKPKTGKNNETNIKNEKAKPIVSKKPPLNDKKKVEEKVEENTLKNEVNSSETNTISEPKVEMKSNDNFVSEQNFSTIDGNKNIQNESPTPNKDQVEVNNTN